MFSRRVSETISIRLLDARNAVELFDLIQKNLDRLAVWCPWLDQVTTIEKTRDFLRGKLDRFAADNGLTAGIFYKTRLSGVIALEYVDWVNSSTEIGYWLDADVEGMGIVTGTCREFLRYAFEELKLNRVQIRCATDNVRSRSVPERLGFFEEGVFQQVERLPDRFVDLVVYRMLLEEWQKETVSLGAASVA